MRYGNVERSHDCSFCFKCKIHCVSILFCVYLIAVTFCLAFINMKSIFIIFFAGCFLASHAVNLADSLRTRSCDPMRRGDGKFIPFRVARGGHCCPLSFKCNCVLHYCSCGLSCGSSSMHLKGAGYS